MTFINYGLFRGARPGVDPTLLTDDVAQICDQALLTDGKLAPMRGKTFEWLPTKAGTIDTIYKAYGSHWFHWAEDVNVVKSPVANDSYNRHYWTRDSGVPQYTTAAISTSGGGTNYPTNAYDLGIPAPTNGAGVSVGGSSTEESPQDRNYLYSFLSAYGEEGPPSPLSAMVTVKPGEEVTLSGLDTAPAGNYNITQKRIYRRASGDSAGEYFYVTTVAIGETEHVDSQDPSELSTSLYEAETYYAPHADLHGLIAHPSGMLVGFVGNTVHLSEPYLPHAWPHSYAFEYDVIGLGVFGTTIVVCTTGFPYLLTGINPGFLSKGSLDSFKQKCVSKRSIASVSGGVVYAGNNGLCLVGPGGADIVTRKHGAQGVPIFTEAQWRAMAPDTMIGVSSSRKYYCWYDAGATEGGFIYDPTDDTITTVQDHVTAAYRDVEQDLDNLFVVDEDDSGNIVVYDDPAGSQLTATWRGQNIRKGRPYPIRYGIVDATAYPVTLKVYVTDKVTNAESLVKTITVTGPGVFPIINGRHRMFSFELITSAGTIRSLQLASSIGEVVSGRV